MGALYNGRKFRAYREFTGAVNLKAVFTKPFLLTAQRLHLDTGQARLVISVGSTEVTPFNTAVPTVFPMNALYILPTELTVTTGGTLTGGSEREVLRANAGGGAGAEASLAGERRLPAGTYYFTITVTGSTSGVYSIEYETLS